MVIVSLPLLPNHNNHNHIASNGFLKMTKTAPPPKVLCPEKISSDGLGLLRASLDVHERTGLSEKELLALIPEYDAIIVRSETKVTAELLAAGKKLRVVVCCTTTERKCFALWLTLAFMLRQELELESTTSTYQPRQSCMFLAESQPRPDGLLFNVVELSL